MGQRDPLTQDSTPTQDTENLGFLRGGSSGSLKKGGAPQALLWTCPKEALPGRLWTSTHLWARAASRARGAAGPAPHDGPLAAHSARASPGCKGAGATVCCPSAFLPGPAPPLPPHKAFPIAQIAHPPPLALVGLRGRTLPRGSHTPSSRPRPGPARPGPGTEPPTSASPSDGAVLGAGAGGPPGFVPAPGAGHWSGAQGSGWRLRVAEGRRGFSGCNWGAEGLGLSVASGRYLSVLLHPESALTWPTHRFSC